MPGGDQRERLPPFSPGFLAQYEVTGTLGEGGMGTVFRARQKALGRPVAIKVLKSSDAADVARFIREGRMLSALASPDIVTVIDAGMDGEVPYLVLELIDGVTLDVVTAKGRPALGDALAWIAGTARALAFAHERSILHRDVKPANVFLCTDGRVKLADFGLARDGQVGHTVTAPGMIMGTPAYIAPEQVRGQRASAASDVYQLGVMAFELLTGTLPFVGEGAMEIALVRLSSPVPQPRLVDPELPRALDGLVARMLANRQEDRATALDVASEAQALVAQFRSEGKPAGLAKASRSSHAVVPTTIATPAAPRRPAWLLGAMVLTGALVSVWIASRPPPPPPPPVVVPRVTASSPPPVHPDEGLMADLLKVADDLKRFLAAVKRPPPNPIAALTVKLIENPKEVGHYLRTAVNRFASLLRSAEKLDPNPEEWLCVANVANQLANAVGGLELPDVAQLELKLQPIDDAAKTLSDGPFPRAVGGLVQACVKQMRRDDGHMTDLSEALEKVILVWGARREKNWTDRGHLLLQTASIELLKVGVDQTLLRQRRGGNSSAIRERLRLVLSWAPHLNPTRDDPKDKPHRYNAAVHLVRAANELTKMPDRDATDARELESALPHIGAAVHHGPLPRETWDQLGVALVDLTTSAATAGLVLPIPKLPEAPALER